MIIKFSSGNLLRRWKIDIKMILDCGDGRWRELT
jgi:hypothetical protein